MTDDSNSDGMGTGTGYDTMRGREYPTIRQFTVFLENRVGQLLGIVRRFEGGHVRIISININDAAECCVVRLILRDPEAGREILERAGLAMIESDLIAMELPDNAQPLLSVCSALLQAEVNIIQALPLMLHPAPWRDLLQGRTADIASAVATVVLFHIKTSTCVKNSTR